MKRVVLVGGGTAGHVEPALAVCNWLRKQSDQIALEFIGTKSGIEVELLVDTAITFHPIAKVPFPRALTFKTIIWPFKFIFATTQALSAIKGSSVVIGFGGYVSAPAYLAAKLLNIPLVLHEANAKPGLANILGAKLTKDIFIAFESAKSLGGRWAKAINVGMPIKSEIDEFNKLDRAKLANEFLSDLNLSSDKKTLLIFGGSIGAKQINSAIADSLVTLNATGWNVVHSVGSANVLPSANGNYVARNYIANMVGAYAAADFVISRSGAVTCAELQAVGVPALLVPLKIGNGEQSANAQELLESGQALKVENSEFTSKWLQENIAKVLERAPKRTGGQTRHAAAKIGESVLRIIRVNQ
ncbi:MAG: hypothetical protein RL129_597 [Actinomycetota bacterium]